MQTLYMSVDGDGFVSKCSDLNHIQMDVDQQNQ